MYVTLCGLFSIFCGSHILVQFFSILVSFDNQKRKILKQFCKCTNEWRVHVWVCGGNERAWYCSQLKTRLNLTLATNTTHVENDTPRKKPKEKRMSEPEKESESEPWVRAYSTTHTHNNRIWKCSTSLLLYHSHIQSGSYTLTEKWRARILFNTCPCECGSICVRECVCVWV